MLYLIVTTYEKMAETFATYPFNDHDFNGENGEEFTSDKANKRGLSDQQYASLTASLISQRVPEWRRVEKFLDVFLDHWDITSSDYYLDFDYRIERIGDQYAIAIECTEQD